MNRNSLIFLLCLVLLPKANILAQVWVAGQNGENPITVAVPFVSFAPDSRGAAMGDAGVATSPDAFSAHWNNAKLAFIPHDMGFSFSYSPWLGNIVDDMSLNYLTFYKRIDPIQTFGATMRYFDLGEIQLTDVQGLPQGIENPREVAFDATYSRALIADRLSAGLSIRYIWSNMTGNITGAPSARAGNSLAFDLGTYYRQPVVLGELGGVWSSGLTITNIGQKISYASEEFEDFIPGNIRLGTALLVDLDPYNSLTFTVDFNKLMVPTPPIYAKDENGDLVHDAEGNLVIEKGKDPNRPFLSGTFGSFTDAPNGFPEELSEIMLSFGAEYWYRDLFAFRSGYFWEHAKKGDRKFFTIGLGFRYQVFGVDFSYLIPQEQNHPLGDTLRLSFLFNMEKKETQPIPSTTP